MTVSMSKYLKPYEDQLKDELNKYRDCLKELAIEYFHTTDPYSYHEDVREVVDISMEMSKITEQLMLLDSIKKAPFFKNFIPFPASMPDKPGLYEVVSTRKEYSFISEWKDGKWLIPHPEEVILFNPKDRSDDW